MPGTKRKERYIATFDEVIIIRDGDYALIAYKEEGVGRPTFKSVLK